MEKIIVDLALVAAGVALAFVAVGASIGAADGGPNPSWAWPVALSGVAMFLLGSGLLAAKIVSFLLSIWR